MEKILIAMPVGTGQVSTSMVEFIWNLELPEGYKVSFLTISRQPVDVARNQFIKLAVNQEYDWILFLDDDNVPEDRGFLKKLLSHDKKMITGLVPARKPYYNGVYPLCIFKTDQKTDGSEYYNQYVNIPEKGLTEVDMCGAGCFLRHKDVFVPLFKRFEERPCEAKRLRYYRIGDEWIPEDDVEKAEIKEGTLRYKARNSEDILLFERAKRLTGEKIRCDTTIRCTHIGETKLVNIKEDIQAKNFSLSLNQNGNAN